MQTWLLLTITAIVAAALTALGGILYIRAAYSDQQDPDDRLAELERQVKTIETRQKNIELEWENTFDKLRRLVGRVDRVRAVDEKKKSPHRRITTAGRRATHASHNGTLGSSPGR